MKSLNAHSLFFEFKKRQWDEDSYYHLSSLPCQRFTKEGLSTSSLRGLMAKKGFAIYSSDPFFLFEESMPQTVADIPSLMEWVDWLK